MSSESNNENRIIDRHGNKTTARVRREDLGSLEKVA
jgi:hypothetical protein